MYLHFWCKFTLNTIQNLTKKHYHICTTYVRFAVTYEKITVMSVLIQYCIALITRNGSVIPRLTGQIRSFRLICGIILNWWRRWHCIVSSIHRIVAAARQAATKWWCGQILGQFLQIVAWHQSNLAVIVTCLVPERAKHSKLEKKNISEIRSLTIPDRRQDGRESQADRPSRTITLDHCSS